MINENAHVIAKKSALVAYKLTMRKLSSATEFSEFDGVPTDELSEESIDLDFGEDEELAYKIKMDTEKLTKQGPYPLSVVIETFMKYWERRSTYKLTETLFLFNSAHMKEKLTPEEVGEFLHDHEAAGKDLSFYATTNKDPERELSISASYTHALAKKAALAAYKLTMRKLAASI